MNYAILFAGIPFDIWISILFSTYSFNISLILYFWLLIFANFRCFLESKSFISHSFWSFHYWSWLLHFTAAWPVCKRPLVYLFCLIFQQQHSFFQLYKSSAIRQGILGVHLHQISLVKNFEVDFLYFVVL